MYQFAFFYVNALSMYWHRLINKVKFWNYLSCMNGKLLMLFLMFVVDTNTMYLQHCLQDLSHQSSSSRTQRNLNPRPCRKRYTVTWKRNYSVQNITLKSFTYWTARCLKLKLRAGFSWNGRIFFALRREIIKQKLSIILSCDHERKTGLLFILLLGECT
jgi:hypothetical protein